MRTRALDRWILVGLASLVALLPNWVGLKLTDFAAPTINNNPHLDSGGVFDIFTGQKFLVLMVLGGVTLALFAYRTWADRGDLEPSPLHIPLLMMLAGILLSLAASPFPWIALTGVPRHTMLGSLTWIVDLGLFFVALHTAGRVAGAPRILLWAFAPFALINGVLVTIWFYGTDLMGMEAVRLFFYPPGKVTLTGIGALITTLGNQNYASGLGAVVTAGFFVYGMLAGSARERWASVACAWFGFAMVAGSLSSSGFVTLLVVTPVGLGLAAWLAATNRRQALITGAAALAGFAVVLAVFAAQNPRVWSETAGGVGSLLSATVDGTAAEGAGSAAGGAGSGPDAALPPEVRLPPYLETAGTGRVYIWKETVKLALQRPFTGWGMDTIAYTFPQNDPAGGQRQLVVKPHSIYLAVLYGSGFFGFAGLVGLLAVGAWRGLTGVFRRELDPARTALLAAVGAYLVQGLVNDGMLGMSTLFWVAAGVALGREGGSRALEAGAEAPRAARRDRRRRR